MVVFQLLAALLRILFSSRAALATENLACRQQLIVLHRSVKHPRIHRLDRIFTNLPTAAWTARQITEAFPYSEAPRFLLRDRDSIYGQEFEERVARMGIEEVRTAYRSPWQNAHVERVIGSIRRECLDHMIVFSESHLSRILAQYVDYYNNSRCHQSLDGNSPVPREVEPPGTGSVVSIPQVGGLHHRYTRAA